MPLKLKTPEEKEFQLLQSDPSGETTILVRQATMRENTLRADLWATASRIMRDGMGSEIELKQRISMPEIMEREVYLTLVACNIEAESGPLFKFARDSSTGRPYLSMSEAKFHEAWGMLPADVALEIHSKVIEVNPTWGAGLGEG
jgi:hypothetical protein